MNAPNNIALPSAPVSRAEKLALTIDELAQELSLNRATIYRLEARGLLRSVPHIRHKIYARGEVDRFLAGKAVA